ncbi:MAG TPA: sigma-70 family RNA polymerase sigma factor, partial [Candidatus Limivivens merdigallinarum]|nr:sigma-70 family RNA polymerase sigma factor [Candidatus Limivivens merdigallinarum]
DVVEISLATMCSADRENITTVKALLDEIENEALFNLLRSADKETLQIVFFRMLDIPTEQIAEKMGLTPNAIYLRINRLKEKIKKLKMGERK